jgi:organic hydroperoxide reductase OsmC/OhrA
MADVGPKQTAEARYLYLDELAWGGGEVGTVAPEGAPPLALSRPPEFGGKAGVWNPEQLLLAAANGCLMNTYLALARKARIEVASYACAGTAVLAPDAEGGYAITRVELRPTVAVSSEADAERAHKLFATAEKRCVVARSLRYPPEVHAQVRVGAVPAASPRAGAAPRS